MEPAISLANRAGRRLPKVLYDGLIGELKSEHVLPEGPINIRTFGGDHVMHRDFTLFRDNKCLFYGVYDRDAMTMMIQYAQSITIPSISKDPINMHNVLTRAVKLLELRKVTLPYGLWWKEEHPRDMRDLPEQVNYKDLRGKGKGKDGKDGKGQRAAGDWDRKWDRGPDGRGNGGRGSRAKGKGDRRF